MSKRAIFEDVGASKADAPAPAKASAPEPARGAIGAWLVLLAGLVAIMVLVGGLTRLTDSGLSITVWDPVMGVVPPLSATDWDDAFAAYQGTTEFQDQNSWMTLADFKPIYWWEWGHRALGRLIGLVWALGFLWFLARRQIPEGWTGRLVLPGLLGGVQGAIGWWMVHGGLDALDVPSYRLAIHLGLAFAIFGLLVWYALLIRLDAVETLKARRRRAGPAMRAAGVLGALAFAQILTGALVAGIDAGRSFVDWPLMQGQIVPPGAFALEPVWRNLFENAGLVQFVHRLLGYALVVVGIGAAVIAARSGIGAVRGAGRVVAGALVAQMVIGIVTVMHAAPIGLASLHQAGALAVFALIVVMRFRAAYPAAERLSA